MICKQKENKRIYFNDVLADIMINLSDILIAKNTDYGDSYDKRIEEYGHVALLIRLEDKLERLKTLYKKGSHEVNETIDDTLKDLAGYCILELVRKNRFIQTG
ncbi:nucleotide modification associated domain-containing protein [Paenibacillus larvae]|uniref:Nucleotide modification associated domain-containing protein n=1 Tax=Paenibacillus larvae subsp. larvae TaxID=147375 RepID=A0A6C0QZ28_9BACL|nr:nucleotide modification associated domain-containing protein [Paenibacillus larvae]QHZ54004.1 hypothetical protein ERICV_05020 [Paenibacillus larvae subsp. larvae]